MNQHFPEYSKKLLPIARAHRRNMTDAERRLRSSLRNKQLGIKFRRQVPLGQYLADFYCIKAKLVIELDGNQHDTNIGIQKDLERDNYLRGIGCTVIRSSNNGIFEMEDGLLQDIFEHEKVKAGTSIDSL